MLQFVPGLIYFITNLPGLKGDLLSVLNNNFNPIQNVHSYIVEKMLEKIFFMNLFIPSENKSEY